MFRRVRLMQISMSRRCFTLQSRESPGISVWSGVRRRSLVLGIDSMPGDFKLGRFGRAGDRKEGVSLGTKGDYLLVGPGKR